MVGCSEFACSMKLESSSLVPVQMRKMSSINLYQTRGFLEAEVKRSFSNLVLFLLLRYYFCGWSIGLWDRFWRSSFI